MNGLYTSSAHQVNRTILQELPHVNAHHKGKKRQKMYTPIHHNAFLNLTLKELHNQGWWVKNEQHALTPDRARYFGLLELGRLPTANWNDPGRSSPIVGLINTHDGSKAATIAIGTRVWVCDNLSLSGEVVVARKHTRNIFRDLENLIRDAVHKFRTMQEQEQVIHRQFQETTIQNRDAHHFIMQTLIEKAILPKHVTDIVGQWHMPRHEDFRPRTAWSLFNAFTDTLKPVNPRSPFAALTAMGDRTRKVQNMLHEFTEN
jgi:hypothetical protein